VRLGGGIFKRSSRYFEVQKDETSQPIFGEALAFYEVAATNDLLVVYHPPHNPQKILKRWRGTWSDDIHVLEVTQISGLVGIWCFNSRSYVLRKHPGLGLLSQEECGIEEDKGEDE
jgi:hypothetical protein